MVTRKIIIGGMKIGAKDDHITPSNSIFRTIFNLDPTQDDITRTLFEAQPCRQDPLDNPKWKRWSR